MTLLAEKISLQVIRSAISCGITDFCLCPGARNVPFVKILKNHKYLRTHYFYDERSAGFFALGRCRSQDRPVAVITTSGTAVAHLLPAAMEAYYTGTPLLFITADRPKSHRGCNTPQSCEQAGIYGVYTPFCLDLEDGDEFDLQDWDQLMPAHINICLEEAALYEDYPEVITCPTLKKSAQGRSPIDSTSTALHAFISKVKHPLVVLGSIKPAAQKPVEAFLEKLNAPVILEAPSGLREAPCMQHIRITDTHNCIKNALEADYDIDGILRIGGVPTCRLWRDLEYRHNQLEVLSINEVPFAGLTWGKIRCTALQEFFDQYQPPLSYPTQNIESWLTKDQAYQRKLLRLFEEEPESEPALIHALSNLISANSMVYLGNSLPIREWDLAATSDIRHAYIQANRGVNGIDGQTSTFLGLAQPDLDNWAILGDLTALHDLSGPWILHQMHLLAAQIVVVNNGGGKIFERMFAEVELQNNHLLDFRHVAALWKIQYELWNTIPKAITLEGPRIIELVPDAQATHRFWHKLSHSA